MAVDDRYKRASAMQVCQVYMQTTHTDTTSGVDDEERWAVTWMYSGISVGAAVVPEGGPRKLLLLGVGN